MGVCFSVPRLVIRPLRFCFSCVCRLFWWLMANFTGFWIKPKPSLPGRNHTEFSSGYYSQPDDSTREDEDSDEENKELLRIYHMCVSTNARAVRDMRNYRKMCQEIDSDTIYIDELRRLYSEGKIKAPNLRFYQNKMTSRPDGVSIEEFINEWVGDYERLEWVHSYIQWLFPIQEPGMNYEAHVLTPEEIQLFRADDEAKERLWCSYKLMLDFYGIKLLDDKTGEVIRAENWEERFENLNSNTHNNLRITRILKCLGILGFEHYQAPLVKFFLHETLVEGTLRRVKQSVLDYFIFTVLDRSERKELIRFALEHIENEESRSNRNQGTFLRVTGSNKAEKSEPKCSESESDTRTQSEDASGSFHNNSDDEKFIKTEVHAKTPESCSDEVTGQCNQQGMKANSDALEESDTSISKTTDDANKEREDQPEHEVSDTSTPIDIDIDPSSQGPSSDSVSTGTSDVNDHSNDYKGSDSIGQTEILGTAASDAGLCRKNDPFQGDDEASSMETEPSSEVLPSSDPALPVTSEDQNFIKECTNSNGQDDIPHSPGGNNEEAANKADNTSLIRKDERAAVTDKLPDQQSGSEIPVSSHEDESEDMETTFLY